jgi:hypothetical protein
MIRAIMDGKKSVTRRVVKQQPDNEHFADGCPYTKTGWALWKKGNLPGTIPHDGCTCTPVSCPYQPGDILWVQETWKVDSVDDANHEMIIVLKAAAAGYMNTAVICKFTEERYLKFRKFYQKPGWQSPYFMPREAARLFLLVEDVRVERLQEIGEADARAEGIKSYWAEPHRDDAPFIGAAKEIGADLCFTRREAFQQLWDYINAKRDYPWVSNPYVWVISFERTERPVTP